MRDAENVKYSQMRFYSISSSPKYVDKSVHITAVVTQYKIGERQINGVCTTYLKDLVSWE